MTIVLIKGDDETLVAQAVRRAVNEFVGDGDRSLMVEEVGEAHYLGDGGEVELGPLVNAAQSPPFLTDRRVVVGRNLALFTRAEQVAPLVELVTDPLSTTDLVLVWERGSTSNRLGAVPKKLKDALQAAGVEEVDAAPSGRGRKGLLDERLSSAPVRLDQGAKRLVADRFGDEVGRVESLLETLRSTFGDGATLGADDVEPFLGAAADVPPWELTDAIDSGDIVTALDKLHRMTQGGDRHALQILATLHGHYQRALGLDGAPVGDERSAAAHLGMTGSTFPARKALALSRRMGSERLAAVVALLAQADLDVRGASAVPPDALLDVLVARLARLSR
ncbi:MAG: DNA polymerase III subunit delta [Acidimicrobiales bacterium]